MTKRVILATLAVFVAWAVLDFLIHGVLLRGAYEATAALWRPMNEMKMGVMYLAVALSSFAFVYVFARFFARRSFATGVWYGLMFGIGVGAGMGYGSYAVMPIPYTMALVWFWGTVVEAVVAGALVGLILRVPED